MDHDSSVEPLDSLCFILSRLLDELFTKLAPLATNELRVILTLEHAPARIGTLRLPAPMRDSKTLLKLRHLELSGNSPAAPIVKVLLYAEPVEPRRTQRSLFCRLVARSGAA